MGWCMQAMLPACEGRAFLPQEKQVLMVMVHVLDWVMAFTSLLARSRLLLAITISSILSYSPWLCLCSHVHSSRSA